MDVTKLQTYATRYRNLLEEIAEREELLSLLAVEMKDGAALTNMEVRHVRRWLKAEQKGTLDKLEAEAESSKIVGDALRLSSEPIIDKKVVDKKVVAPRKRTSPSAAAGTLTPAAALTQADGPEGVAAQPVAPSPSNPQRPSNRDVSAEGKACLDDAPQGNRPDHGEPADLEGRSKGAGHSDDAVVGDTAGEPAPTNPEKAAAGPETLAPARDGAATHEDAGPAAASIHGAGDGTGGEKATLHGAETVSPPEVDLLDIPGFLRRPLPAHQEAA